MIQERSRCGTARTLSQEEEALGECDFVHSQARARLAATILQLPLSNSFFRLTPLEFVSWFRFQFRIPSWHASILPTTAESSSVSLAAGVATSTDTGITRILVLARPPYAAEAQDTAS
jgi:hypothetical protein